MTIPGLVRMSRSRVQTVGAWQRGEAGRDHREGSGIYPSPAQDGLFSKTSEVAEEAARGDNVLTGLLEFLIFSLFLKRTQDRWSDN